MVLARSVVVDGLVGLVILVIIVDDLLRGGRGGMRAWCLVGRGVLLLLSGRGVVDDLLRGGRGGMRAWCLVGRGVLLRRLFFDVIVLLRLGGRRRRRCGIRIVNVGGRVYLLRRRIVAVDGSG
jgi:hypothetical protein